MRTMHRLPALAGFLLIAGCASPHDGTPVANTTPVNFRPAPTDFVCDGKIIDPVARAKGLTADLSTFMAAHNLGADAAFFDLTRPEVISLFKSGGRLTVQFKFPYPKNPKIALLDGPTLWADIDLCAGTVTNSGEFPSPLDVVR